MYKNFKSYGNRNCKKHNNENLYIRDELIMYYLLSGLLKDSRYSDENEHRIMVFSINSLDKYENYFISSTTFRQFIKPYISIPLELNKVFKSLTLSPILKNTPINKDVLIHDFNKFLKKSGFNSDEIQTSYSNANICW